MSYCRWSSDNGYCDVYVYEDANGGWTTHVVSRRYPEGRPDGFMTVFGRLCNNNKPFTAEDHKAMQEAKMVQEAWDSEHPMIAIDNSLAGSDFNHPSPGRCADNLELLKSEGFNVPQYAIDALREEQVELEKEKA